MTNPLARMLIVGITYLLFARVGASFTVTDVGISVLWLANAVLLAAFLVCPPRQWPLMALGALIGELLAGYGLFPFIASLPHWLLA